MSGDYNDSYHAWKPQAHKNLQLYDYEEELVTNASQNHYNQSATSSLPDPNYGLGPYSKQQQNGGSYLFYPNLTDLEVRTPYSGLPLQTVVAGSPACRKDFGASCSSDRLFSDYVPDPDYEFFEPMYFDMVRNVFKILAARKPA